MTAHHSSRRSGSTTLLRLALIASGVVLGTTACGGAAGETSSSGASAAMKPSPNIDTLGRFGPYELGMPWASVPDVKPELAKFGGFQAVKQPLVYAGSPHKVTMYAGTKTHDKVGWIALAVERPACDAVLAQMQKDFGPAGRVRHGKVTVAGEEKKTTNYAWKGKTVGATFENAAFNCAASVMLLGEAPDYTGAFAD
jgi:hypothetical protein